MRLTATKLLLLFSLTICLVSNAGNAADPKKIASPVPFPITHAEALDGGTIVADIDLGFGILLKQEKIRLYKVTAYDSKSLKGEKAVRYIKSWIGVYGDGMQLLAVRGRERDEDGYVVGLIAKKGGNELTAKDTLNRALLDLEEESSKGK